MTETEVLEPQPQEKRFPLLQWIAEFVLLAGILAGAAWLRFTGSDWGEMQHQHPDELFLTSVTYDIAPVNNIIEYFDTQNSTLNPHNRGHGFYVYGTLPVFIVRYIAEWTHQLDNLKMLGRQASAMADLLTLVFLYLIVRKKYGWKPALLATAFSALAVMQIQQSHFYTTDLFVNFFLFVAIYFAVLVEEEARRWLPPEKFSFETIVGSRMFWLCLAFGLGLGMAVASKVNAGVLAIMLPAAFGIGLLDRESAFSKNRPGLERVLWIGFGYMAVGAVFALLAFRVFQPYAFDGLGLNPKWTANIAEQRGQANGQADLPWNLQWARRTHLYSFENLTVWGLGLPLGILAWAGFLWMGWRTLRGEWTRHILLWGWTAFYFGWQSLQFNPTMRYQLPVYPLLAMMAAWGVYTLAQAAKSDAGTDEIDVRPHFRVPPAALRAAAWLLGIVVLGLTTAWAIGFASIYTRPEPRIAASRWIYENIPAPINLKIETENGSTYSQLVPFYPGTLIGAGQPYSSAFSANATGKVQNVTLPHVSSQFTRDETLVLTVARMDGENAQPIAQAVLTSKLQGGGQDFTIDPPLPLENGITYRFEVRSPDPETGPVDLCGTWSLVMQGAEPPVQIAQVDNGCVTSSDSPVHASFTATGNSTLTNFHLANAEKISAPAGVQTLTVSISTDPEGAQVLGQAQLTADFTPTHDPRGETYIFRLDRPVQVTQNNVYYARITTSGSGVTLRGATITNETDYDYPLPFRVDGYDGFGGLYSGDLNLQVYWDDNSDKLVRFTDTLNSTDYILIPTNHQYAQITRIPERFPLTTLYYRELIGCPQDKDIIWCYRTAEPGSFEGRLGFDLVATFTDYPRLGPIEINDGPAEEAFTFYDHPKVLVFKKRADYDAAKVSMILSSVDLSKVVHLLPKEADSYRELMLSQEQLKIQQAGGTWSELFDYNWIQNRYPGLGLLLWYVFLLVLGLVAYPLVRLALPGLADRGYPLSRAAGMLILAWLAWSGGSLGIPYTRITIGILFALLVIAGLAAAWFQRSALREEWNSNRRAFLIAEAVFLAFFLIDLAIRLGNPDLWHPSKGGERPMDFSYFNAVLKSTIFPPYDPWFAGGYINYYYFGFVLVGTPVKLLGIVPSIAYNFLLPTLFAMVAVGAFSVVYNLLDRGEKKAEEQPAPAESDDLQPLDAPRRNWLLPDPQVLGGLAASVGVVLIGNLGTFRMIYQALQKMVTPDINAEHISVFQRWIWAAQGIGKLFTGATLPLGPGEWYWQPSRVIPAIGEVEPITEFPFFTFLYSDLHAHMIVLPLALLALAWIVSMVRSRGRWENPLGVALGLLLGGMVIGAIRPTNTWDFYTYLPLAAIATLYSVWRGVDESHLPWLKAPLWIKRLSLAVGGAALLAVLSLGLYEPYSRWFGMAYNAIDPWKGTHTPMTSYLLHWGLFLFIITSWMLWETRDWLATTPYSALNKLAPYRYLIEFFGVLVLGILVLLAFLKVNIGWLAIPLAVWALILILRPGTPDAKRLILFMIGTALMLTVVVEVIVLRGDISRMNTVFKLYLQAWTLFAVSAAAGLGWLLPAMPTWLPKHRNPWSTIAALLFAGTLLYTLTATMDKVRDRMAQDVPFTFDSMTYMNYAKYWDNGDMDLSADYRAIRWVQDHVTGSPVIVEANTVEYRWGSRYTIYTGLPGVVGWNWHQRQQRAMMSTRVEARVAEISAFYTTKDVEAARAFLAKYNVRYIIVGQLEHNYFQPESLAKFEQYDGRLWKEVYRDGDTVIYEVIP
jgi:YYY domain-containing protein